MTDSKLFYREAARRILRKRNLEVLAVDANVFADIEGEA